MNYLPLDGCYADVTNINIDAAVAPASASAALKPTTVGGIFQQAPPVKIEQTAQLIREFDTVYSVVELTHLTPPQSPPRMPEEPMQVSRIHVYIPLSILYYLKLSLTTVSIFCVHIDWLHLPIAIQHPSRSINQSTSNQQYPSPTPTPPQQRHLQHQHCGRRGCRQFLHVRRCAAHDRCVTDDIAGHRARNGSGR